MNNPMKPLATSAKNMPRLAANDDVAILAKRFRALARRRRWDRKLSCLAAAAPQGMQIQLKWMKNKMITLFVEAAVVRQRLQQRKTVLLLPTPTLTRATLFGCLWHLNQTLVDENE